MCKRNKNGFTLIEILVGLALFAAMMVVSNTILFSALKNARKTTAISKAKSEGAYILNVISKDIKFSDSVPTIVGGTCSTNSLQLKRMPPDSSNVVYSFVSPNVSRTIGAATSVMNSTGANGVVISLPGDCLAHFTCTGNLVTICFSVNVATTTDVSDSAGVSGIRFYTQVQRTNP